MPTHTVRSRAKGLDLPAASLVLLLVALHGCSSSSTASTHPEADAGGSSADAARKDATSSSSGSSTASSRGDAAASTDGGGRRDAAARADAGAPACTLSPVGASCEYAYECCQSGPGLPQGQACFTVGASGTRTCRPRCNTSSECAPGSCCIADGSSYPAFGSAPTEPGGFCYPMDAGVAACIKGYANGYACTGTDDTGFVCQPETTDAGPTRATCMSGVTAYCGCQVLGGEPCTGADESADFAECIDGLSATVACYAGYPGSPDGGAERCSAAHEACR